MSDDVLQYIPALRVYARVLCKSVPDADDLVQETLLRAIEHADQYRSGTNMRAWLFTIMRNRFFTNCHKSARERTGAADCVALQVSVEPDQEWHMRAVEVGEVLQQLPPYYREALILVGSMGESYIDAARILDCDIGTIKSRVSRARGLLKEAMGEAA